MNIELLVMGNHLSHLEWIPTAVGRNERSLLKRAALFEEDLSLAVEMTFLKGILGLKNTTKNYIKLTLVQKMGF